MMRKKLMALGIIMWRLCPLRWFMTVWMWMVESLYDDRFGLCVGSMPNFAMGFAIFGGAGFVLTVEGVFYVAAAFWFATMVIVGTFIHGVGRHFWRNALKDAEKIIEDRERVKAQAGDLSLVGEDIDNG